MKAFPGKCFSLFHLTGIFLKAMFCFMKDSKQMANKALQQTANRRRWTLSLGKKGNQPRPGYNPVRRKAG